MCDRTPHMKKPDMIQKLHDKLILKFLWLHSVLFWITLHLFYCFIATLFI